MPKKHIEAKKLQDGSFIFEALAIPNDIPKATGLKSNQVDLDVIDMQFNGDSYFVYCAASLSSNDIQQLKADWVKNGPEPSDMVLFDTR